MEDYQIIIMLFERSEAALDHLAKKYAGLYKRILWEILRDESDMEECANDVLLAVWNSIPPNAPRNYLFAFLVRIIRHISIDRCRYRQRLCRKGYIQELSDELLCCIPGNPDEESRIDSIVLGQSISNFLRSQPELNRNVFIRRYWYLDSVEAICRRYHISQSKAKSMLFRSRNALRTHLRKEGFTL